MKLSEKQQDCLRVASKGSAISPWDFGSTTISVLKKNGFIKLVAGIGSGYAITEEGRKALAGP